MKQMDITQAQADREKQLKQEYNELLKRYHKANEYFQSAEPEESAKFEAAYQKILTRMQDILNELRKEYGIITDHKTTLGGF